MNNTHLMNKVADNIRILSVSMVEKAKSGHPGGAMGGSDFINVLFSEFLEYDPNNPHWEFRDRFFLDPGHMSPMLYSVLCLSGKFSIDDLKEFRQWKSVTPGHPELNIDRGIENTSGPLGQGHAIAAGAAIAAKFMEARFGDIIDYKIYSYISDGTIQEEVSQGVGRIAGHLGLSNLIMFYDSNNIQLSTKTNDVTSEDIEKKYKSWDWNVITINGNNVDDIRNAINAAKEEKNRPTLIIGNTTMGKGALGPNDESFEDKVSTHGQPLTAAGADFNKTIKNLGGDPDNSFQIFKESKELYEKRKIELQKIVNLKNKKIEDWKNNNPELEAKRQKWFSNEKLNIDWSNIKQNIGASTRSASANVLSVLAQSVDNIIVSSADLSNSDKTDGFLKHKKSFEKNDFSGAFLQAGVSEFTMACLCLGISLHGGIIPICGTFFVFSDYMKPVIRLACLMEKQIIFIWTHDSFRVGEDGPTHQPIEQEAQIRLMEKVKNHSNKNSLLVLRPSNVYETTVSWSMAIENNATPTALILSRQDIKDTSSFSKYNDALQAKKGAYIVKDDDNFDVILIASGSEVSTLIDGAELLNKDGIKTRVVSIPSEGLFRTQSLEYQNEILPKGSKIFGLTAGLSVTLESVVGHNGVVWGFNSFGFSAPYNVLDKKLGYTAENVFNQVKKMFK